MGAMDSPDTSLPRSRSFLKPIIGGVAVVAFLVVVFFVARSGKSLPQGIVLYYGDGCPHCALVETFVKEKNVEEKVKFERKEVYNNKRNAREMASFAKKCGLPTDSIGIPFLWTGTQCLTGDKDIIAFFQRQL